MLELPFYIKQNNKFHKIDQPTYQSNLDDKTNFYVQKIDDQYWLVTKDPIKVKVNNNITFGRSKDCNIILSNKKATRHHCTLNKIQNNRYLISDLNSKNGTFADGKHVVNSIEILKNPFILKTGNEFWLIDFENKFVETHTTKLFHKYPLVGGDHFCINDKELILQQYEYGVSTDIGRRKRMEDKHIIIPFKDNLAIYMIFDGHGGAGASTFVSQEIEKEIKNCRNLEHIDTYIELFKDVDQRLIATGEKSGTTANIVVLSQQNINVFNAGDCQALVVFEKGFQISRAHRPETELDRLPAHKLVHYKGDTLRVRGNTGLALSVSRAFGDASMKDVIISTPEQNTFSRYNSNLGHALYIIQGCDGVWDFIKPKEVFNFVHANKTLSSQELSDKLLSEILHTRKGRDNISIIAVKLV